MIHAFRALGRNILADVESGAVHVLDDASYKIARAIEENRDPYDAGLGKEETDEIVAELDELRLRGDLMKEADKDICVPFDPTVKSMCLHIAHDCNLRCKYCFAGTGEFHGERSFMSVETAKRALDFLMAHSGGRHNLEIDLFGGEPLMNMPTVMAVVEYGRELEVRFGKHINFTMTTNGVLLNDENIEFLNREMYNVVISIDGRREVNDAVRSTIGGGSAYDLIVKNAQKLVAEREGEYYIRGTFTNKNLDFLNDVVALNDMGFEAISVEPVVLPHEHELAIGEEHLEAIFKEYDRLLELLVDYRARGKKINFFHFNIDLTHGPCLKKRVKGCGAGVEYISVTPDGTIYPCHQFAGQDEFAMGSVYGGTLNEAMQRRFFSSNILTKQKCSSCFAKYFCGGGCAANAYNLSGDISVPYDLTCRLMEKRFECALAKYVHENI